MDGGAWKAAVHGVAEGRTRPSGFTFTFHFHALEKEMVTHSSVLAWRIPGMTELGGLPSMGSHRVGHDWSDLAVAAERKLVISVKWDGSGNQSSFCRGRECSEEFSFLFFTIDILMWYVHVTLPWVTQIEFRCSIFMVLIHFSCLVKIWMIFSHTDLWQGWLFLCAGLLRRLLVRLF